MLNAKWRRWIRPLSLALQHLRSGHPNKTKSRHRPLLEQLEDRLAPATFHVSLSGDDTLGDGSTAAPFRTVQKGIDAATATSDGDDIVKVEAGTYATAGIDLGVSIPSNANLQNLQLLGGF